ncbi:MAG: TA system VapC family ribonuclease toxin [Acidobacteriota bacterium]
MSYLVDVNVWLALSTPGHPHHEPATQWFGESDSKLYFCRVTQMGFLRLVTNPRVMERSVISPERAWTVLSLLLEDSRIAFASEPAGIEQAWKPQTRGHHQGHHFWTDAYLAAFASAAGLTLLTFDRAFARRKDVGVHLLS